MHPLSAKPSPIDAGTIISRTVRFRKLSMPCRTSFSFMTQKQSVEKTVPGPVGSGTGAVVCRTPLALDEWRAKPAPEVAIQLVEARDARR
jgi:hypothetical protein